jgi:hypothetical protein
VAGVAKEPMRGNRAIKWVQGIAIRDGTRGRTGSEHEQDEVGAGGKDGMDGWVLVVFSTFIFLLPPTVVSLLSFRLHLCSAQVGEYQDSAAREYTDSHSLYLQVVTLVLSPASR